MHSFSGQMYAPRPASLPVGSTTTALPSFSGSRTTRSNSREKDDVREVAYGYECGILVPGYAPEIGDSLEVFEIKKTIRTI